MERSGTCGENVPPTRFVINTIDPHPRHPYTTVIHNGLEIDAKVQEVKRKWAEATPTLLIFDNCEDPTLAQEYLPTTGGARVLLTSRDQTWQNNLRQVNQILIETLPREKSVELLRSFRPDLNDRVANGIAKEVGDLPLALHMAGSFLVQYKDEYFNPQTYLAELQNPQLVAKLGKQGIRLKSNKTTRHEWDVARTFLVSLERLAGHHHAEWIQQVLLLIAHLSHGTAIPRGWLLSALPPHLERLDAIDALRRLLEVGVVDTPQTDTVRMHRLVAQVVLASATQEAAASALNQSETVILAVKPTYGETNFVAQMDRWLPHAREVTERALPRRDRQASLLASWIGYLIEKLGLYEQALEWVNRDLDISREVLGSRHSETATSLNNLALLYQSQGKYEAALPLYEEALAIDREILGARHPDTAIDLNNLAGLYKSQGKYEAALPLYEEALGISREVLGARHPDTATSLNNLAGLYESQGRYEAAEPLYEEAVSILVESLGMNHPTTKAGIRNRDYLRSILEQQGNP